ncbi:MAG: TRAP transporter small permease [Methylobacteriaceae bacterium]|nr:TRAP transporter small permease [Methylobacteriaceae bacterium]
MVDRDVGALTAAGLGMPVFRDIPGRAMARAAIVLAMFGVLIIAALACMLCVTIVARKLLGWQVNGDYELVQLAAALSVSMLFPWCHLTGGHVIVDLATARLPGRANLALDRIGSALLGVMALLLAWRTGVLAEQSMAQGAFSPILTLPVWLAQALMLPGLLLTAAIGFYLAIAPQAMSTRNRMAEPG